MADKMFSDITLNDLTDLQRAFIEDTTTAGSFKNIFLTGCAGSGKTLVAAMTAKEFLRQKKDVQFLTYTKFLRKYVEDHFVRQDASISADNFHHWAYQTNKEDEETPSTNLAIIDECQDFTNSMVLDTKRLSNYQIWLGDSNQQIYGQAFDSSGFDQINNTFAENSSDRYEFNTNFRNPMAVAQIAKCFIYFDSKYDKKISSVEEKIKNFIDPILGNANQGAANRNQPNTIIHASDLESEYDAIIEKIEVIQNDERGSKQIVIAGADHTICNEIQEELEARSDINFTRYFSLRPTDRKPEHIDFTNPNLVLISPIATLKGFEADYIIFPRTEKSNINFDKLFTKEIGDIYGKPYNLSESQKTAYIKNLLFMLFSRAKKRVICSYTNEYDSIVYENIKDAMYANATKKYFLKQTSDDVLGGNKNDVKILQDEVDRRHEEVKTEFEKNFPFKKSSMSNNDDDDNESGAPAIPIEIDENDLPF
jgi:hypothetical protein